MIIPTTPTGSRRTMPNIEEPSVLYVSPYVWRHSVAAYSQRSADDTISSRAWVTGLPLSSASM